MEGKMKKYQIIGRNETIRITIPEEWKVTYGRLHGGAEKSGYDPDGNVLRVYETKEKQRAVFNHVESFIDLDIKVEKLVKNYEATQKITHKKGKKTDEAKEVAEETWVEANNEENSDK